MAWSSLANHTVGRGMVSGHLLITNRRVLFTPRLRGGAKALDRPLADVTGAGVEPRGRGLFSGGRSDRLRVELADGEVHLFVVKELDRAVELLARARKKRARRRR